MTLLKVSLWSRFDWNRPINTIRRSCKTLNSVLCSSRTVSHGYWPTSSSTTHPKLTHAAARFLCDSWATCMCWLAYHKRFLRSTNRTLETGISLVNHYVTWYGICIKISITRPQGRYLHAPKYLVAGAWWEAFEMRGKAMVSIKCKKRWTPLGELTLRSPIPRSWGRGLTT